MTGHRHHLEKTAVTVSHPPTTRLCFHLVNERGTHLKRLTDELLADDKRRQMRVRFRLHFLNPVSPSVFVMDHLHDKPHSAAGCHLSRAYGPVCTAS